jgi:hypothetical protein
MTQVSQRGRIDSALRLSGDLRTAAPDLWHKAHRLQQLSLPLDRSAYTEEIIPFAAGDGFQCNLIHVQGKTPPKKGPVLLVHDAGTRANLFRTPTETTIVDYLIFHGYDVWLENWRGSIDLPPNPWILDQVALYDHPEAVKTVVKQTGWDQIKAVIHCQGSTSFMMSAVAGLVPQVTTIVSNAVSLHTIVPAFSHFKLSVALPIITLFTEYLNPQHITYALNAFTNIFNSIGQSMQHGCDNPVCQKISFTYSADFSGLWYHENLNKETHEWVKKEFAHVPLSFLKQIAQCIQAGHLVSMEGERGSAQGITPTHSLPEDFTTRPPQTDARIAFIAGGKNECFLPASQVRTFQFFEQYRQDYHSLSIFPKYGHLDIFMGKNAINDVFPVILHELDKPA